MSYVNELIENKDYQEITKALNILRDIIQLKAIKTTDRAIFIAQSFEDCSIDFSVYDKSSSDNVKSGFTVVSSYDYCLSNKLYRHIKKYLKETGLNKYLRIHPKSFSSTASLECIFFYVLEIKRMLTKTQFYELITYGNLYK